MGAWGEGAFDNDDAADFAGDLSDLTDPASASERLNQALGVDQSGGYLEAPTLNEAIAAAAIVALMLGAPSEPSSYGPSREWLTSMAPIVTSEIRRAAGQVFRRAFDPSRNEWYGLWNEAGAIDEVRAALSVYIRALEL